MVYELSEEEYGRVHPVFEELGNYHIYIDAVIEGGLPGRIVVDDPQSPETAFIWGKSSDAGFYLEGNPDNGAFNRSLNQWILEEVYPEAKGLPGVVDYALYYPPEAWEDRIDVILKDTSANRDERKYFEFERPTVAWKAHIPPDFHMVQIDRHLLERADLKNIDHVIKWTRDPWQSTAHFLEKGFGFCLVNGDDIVSWCLSDYVYGQRCEIGIHTDENYRRQGFAALTVAATVDFCLGNGMTKIGWHCWAPNLASAATARKAGFRHVLDHPVYHAWFNAFDNCLVRGHSAFGRRQFKRSAAWYEKAFEMADSDAQAFLDSEIFSDPDTRKWCYYQAACARAQTGESDAAVRNLGKAVDNGWADVERLKQDENLKCLHATAKWEALLSRLEG